MFEFFALLSLYAGLLIYFRLEYQAHLRRLARYRFRIHVNGIRGKSTVTRLIAGVLREAGYKTLAKTTGSDAVVIDAHGLDRPIQRFAPANIREQIEVIRGWERIGAEAMVLECMAIHPVYQEWAERKAVRAHIAVITNVREDHQELLGFSLEEIARNLSKMCPENGVLITTEENEALRKILEDAARARGTRLIYANPRLVREKELNQFRYLAHKENIAIGLVVAHLLGIDRRLAMAGMIKAPPDIGVTQVQTLSLAGKSVTWANLFAVNDRESLIQNLARLKEISPDTTVRIGLLNNRWDRQRRAEQFVDIVARDIELDWLVTLGAFESLVTKRLVAGGFPADRIVNLGDEHSPSLKDLLGGIAGLVPEGGRALLVGFANIHTQQAEMLMHYFSQQPAVFGARTVDPLATRPSARTPERPRPA